MKKNIHQLANEARVRNVIIELELLELLRDSATVEAAIASVREGDWLAELIYQLCQWNQDCEVAARVFEAEESSIMAPINARYPGGMEGNMQADFIAARREALAPARARYADALRAACPGLGSAVAAFERR
jgi:hypothetical protein